MRQRRLLRVMPVAEELGFPAVYPWEGPIETILYHIPHRGATDNLVGSDLMCKADMCFTC